MYVLKSCFVIWCLARLAVSNCRYQSTQTVYSGNGQICFVPICSARGVALEILQTFCSELVLADRQSSQTDHCGCFGIHYSMSGISLSVIVTSVRMWDMQCRWCPVKEAPYVLREAQDDLKLTPEDLTKLTIDVMPIGTIREFKVGQNL